MGVVYLAEHPVIGKKVAMKAIHPELSRNPDVVSRFVTEAKAVNQIGHEHIVDIADFGNTPSGEFYFIMEYLQGESLADRLKPRDAPDSAGARAAHRLAGRRRAGRVALRTGSSTAISSPRTSSWSIARAIPTSSRCSTSVSPS